MLVLCDFEQFFLNNIKDLPVTKVQMDEEDMAYARDLVGGAWPQVHVANPSIGPQAYQVEHVLHMDLI